MTLAVDTPPRTGDIVRVCSMGYLVETVRPPERATGEGNLFVVFASRISTCFMKATGA